VNIVESNIPSGRKYGSFLSDSVYHAVNYQIYERVRIKLILKIAAVISEGLRDGVLGQINESN